MKRASCTGIGKFPKGLDAGAESKDMGSIMSTNRFVGRSN